MQEWRQTQDIERVWATRDTLMAGIGPDHGAEQVVRSAARLADRLGANWYAVYVETPALQRLAERERHRILKVLQLATELGAQTATIPGNDAAHALVDYARKHNVSKLVVGRTHNNGFVPWDFSIARNVARIASDIDLIQVARAASTGTLGNRVWGDTHREFDKGHNDGLSRYLWTAVGCAVTTTVASLLFPYLDITNIAMFFVLAVVLTALRFGRGPAAFAAVLSVAAFDFFFVPPYFSFAISDIQYLWTFAVLLTVGLITGQLTAHLRYQARVSEHRERRAQALYEMARELSSALITDEVVQIAQRFVVSSYLAKVGVILVDLENRLHIHGDKEKWPANIDMAVAQWAYDHDQAAGLGTDTLPASAALYLPLKAPVRTRGVLAIEPSVPRWMLIPEQRRQLETFCTLISIAIERVHFVEVARDVMVRMESEQLRNSLLSALSHDLRTPLTALVGQADALAVSQPPLSPGQMESATSIRDNAVRLSTHVNDLLDMARLQGGEVKLNLEWLPIEEVVGSAIRATKTILGKRQIATAIPHDLPLVQFDAVMIDRVLHNLLENAAKYTPPDAKIKISAEIVGTNLVVSVADNGPGIQAGMEQAIFDKFMRGSTESAIPGVGLGLAICRSIVEAHQGKLWVESVAGTGARFVFTLPLGSPPTLAAEFKQDA